MKRQTWQEKRAMREAQSRETAARLKSTRETIKRQGAQFFEHDLGQPIGFSPMFELASPYRHGTGVDTKGPTDFTKTPGSET